MDCIVAALDSMVRGLQKATMETWQSNRLVSSRRESQQAEEQEDTNEALETVPRKLADLFNIDPVGNGWLEFAVAEGLLSAPDDAKAVAQLFSTNPHFDKGQIGNYLSQFPDSKYQFNATVRREFVEQLNFQNLSFLAALRLFLSHIRLPGEARRIDCLIESFSDKFYRQQSTENSVFRDVDAVIVLTDSIIWSNWWVGYARMRKNRRVTVESFIRNHRGANNGEDFPEDFLTDLFYNLAENGM